AGTYFLNASGNVTETGTAVAANTVALVASGNIGSSTASTVAVNAPNLTAQAGAGGADSAFVSDSQAVVFVDTGAFTTSASSVTGTYFLNDTGSITQTGSAVTANTVALVASINIGTSTVSPINVNAANLTIRAGSSGADSAFVADSQSAVLVNTGG